MTDQTTTLPPHLDDVMTRWTLDEARDEHAKCVYLAQHDDDPDVRAEFAAIAERIAQHVDERTDARRRDEAEDRGAALMAEEVRRDEEAAAEARRQRDRHDAAVRIVEALPALDDALTTLDRLVQQVNGDAAQVDSYASRLVAREVTAALQHVGSTVDPTGFPRPVHKRDPLAGDGGLTESIGSVLDKRHADLDTSAPTDSEESAA